MRYAAALALVLAGCSPANGGGQDAGPDGTHDGAAGSDAAGTDGAYGGDAANGGDGAPDASHDATTAEGGGSMEGGAGPDAALDGGSCSGHTWHWESPEWTGGVNLNGIVEPATNAVWAVGDLGTIIHWDGTGWQQQPNASTAALRGIWAASVTDLWAVGDGGLVLHGDGVGWSPVASGTTLPLTSVWGTSSSDVWIAGAAASAGSNPAGVVLHWDGHAMSTAYTSPTIGFTSLWASASGEVWAGSNATATGSPTLVHFDGSAWTPVPIAGALGGATSVWGAATNDVWALAPGPVGSDVSYAYHWNGSSWTQALGRGGGPARLYGGHLLGLASSDIWTDGSERWDGTWWGAATNCSGARLAIAGVSDADIWMSSYQGGVWRAGVTGGTSFCGEVLGGGGTPGGSGALWAATYDDAYIITVNGPEQSNGGLVNIPANPAYASFTVQQVWGTSASDVWMAGSLPDIPSALGQGVNAGASHWDGQSWSEPVNIGTGFAGVNGIGGSGPDDVYISLYPPVGPVLPQSLVHWNGTAWSAVTSYPGAGGGWIWGDSPNDVYVVGAVMWHWDGTSWTTPPGTTETGPVWGSGPADVWMAGNPPLHFDGVAWSAQTSLPFRDVSGISGRGASDIWMQADTWFWHWDGTSWVNTGLVLPPGNLVATGGCTVWTDTGAVARFGP